MSKEGRKKIKEARQSQSIDELYRKAFKAKRRGYLTVEGIDLAVAKAAEMKQEFNWE